MKPTLPTPPGMASFLPSSNRHDQNTFLLPVLPSHPHSMRSMASAQQYLHPHSGGWSAQHIRQHPYEKRRDSGVGLPLPIPPPAPAAQAARAESAASKIDSISKSVLTTPRITPSLTLFISAFVHSTWHNTALPPSPTFTNYTAHILSTTALPFSVLLLSLLLVSRLKKRHPDLRGAEGSECRLLVCALVVAMKVLLDNTYTNKTWEKVCGIPVKELNIMEMEFLAQLDFDTHVSEGEYFCWLQHIELAVQSFKGNKNSNSNSSNASSRIVSPCDYPHCDNDVPQPISYSSPPQYTMTASRLPTYPQHAYATAI